MKGAPTCGLATLSVFILLSSVCCGSESLHDAVKHATQSVRHTAGTAETVEAPPTRHSVGRRRLSFVELQVRMHNTRYRGIERKDLAEAG